MASNNNMIASIAKLKGRENWEAWKFATQAYLEMEGLWSSVNGTSAETDDVKKALNDTKARSRLILLIEPINFSHIQDAKSAKEVWDNLKQAFEDSGLMRRVGLLRNLITTKLETCVSIEDYVNRITTTAHKLRGTEMQINDEWIGTLLLAGLSERYEPMIMAIESSGAKVSSDQIKTKLLQEVKMDCNETAYFIKKNSGKQNYKKFQKKKDFKCYTCQETGHISRNCPKNGKTAAKGNSSKTGPVPMFSAVFSTGKFDKNDWYIDSGASNHMTMNEKWLKDKIMPPVKEIVVANNEKISVVASGKLQINCVCFEKINTINVNDVLCVPELTANLLSVSQIIKNGNSVIFNQTGCEIFDRENSLIATAELIGNVYRLKKEQTYGLLSSSIWHRRMGHMNYSDLKKLDIEGIELIKKENQNNACVVCLKGKQAKLPFNKCGNRANELLELIHSDVCGPMETLSLGGARYYVTFIDDFSRKVFVYTIKNKSEVLQTFKMFKNLVETQTDRKIKTLRTDNGGEYCSKEYSQFLGKYGIRHQTTAPYTPQQNGLAERMNRTIEEKVRCMLFDANLKKKFWAEAVNTAVYIINRSIASGLINKSPEEVWTNKKPNLKHLRIFGCKAMVHVPKQIRKKLDSKSKKMVFMGYCDNTKGYRLYDPEKDEIVKSRDVIFIETQPKEDESSIIEITENTEHQDQVQIQEIENRDELDVQELEDCIEEEAEFEDANSDDLTYVPDAEVTMPGEVRRSERLMQQQGLMASHQETCPMTVEEAIQTNEREEWKKAMDNEIKSHMENNSWSLEVLPKDRKSIKCKWVFKIKYDDSGSTKYKARLVAKGCSQKYGIDYVDTYSPVVRYTSIRFLIALAVKMNMRIDQMDAVTAFLQGNLTKEIYMDQPENYHDGTTKVCKLNKAIYGLKQSGRLWNALLENTLKSFGLSKSHTDPCVFFNEKLDLIVAIYVDDILIFWKDIHQRNEIKIGLSSAFKMKDLGEAKNCVGLNITYDHKSNKIWLDQSKYIVEILKKYGMTDSKPVGTPSDANQKLSSQMCKDGNLVGKVPYQEAVGSLLYLVQGTRPDLTFAVNDVSRFNLNYDEPHWKAVKRIFRYLNGTINLKLCFSESKSPLIGYSDADWASDIDKRRSCTGYVFKMSGGSISWASKRQPTVAMSSTEAEYMALASATQEAIWLKQFGQELHPPLKDRPLTIMCDNQGAKALAESDGFRGRSKHIDIKHHFLREHVEDNTISISYIPTEDMVADNLTKAVNVSKHLFCTKNMGLFAT